MHKSCLEYILRIENQLQSSLYGFSPLSISRQARGNVNGRYPMVSPNMTILGLRTGHDLISCLTRSNPAICLVQTSLEWHESSLVACNQQCLSSWTTGEKSQRASTFLTVLELAKKIMKEMHISVRPTHQEPVSALTIDTAIPYQKQAPSE